MATTKPALSGKTTPAVAPKIIFDPNEREVFDQLIQRKVAERAYQLFEASNAAHGKDQEHWLQAESEILQHGLDIRESGSWLSITASLPNVSDDNLQVCIEPNRAVVPEDFKPVGSGRRMSMSGKAGKHRNRGPTPGTQLDHGPIPHQVRPLRVDEPRETGGLGNVCRDGDHRGGEDSYPRLHRGPCRYGDVEEPIVEVPEGRARRHDEAVDEDLDNIHRSDCDPGDVRLSRSRPDDVHEKRTRQGFSTRRRAVLRRSGERTTSSRSDLGRALTAARWSRKARSKRYCKTETPSLGST